MEDGKKLEQELEQELEVPEGIEVLKYNGEPVGELPELYQEQDRAAPAEELQEEPLVPEAALDQEAEELAALEAEIAAEETEPPAEPLPDAPTEDWDLAVLFDDLLVEQIEAPDTLKGIELADTYKDRHRPLEALVLLVGHGYPRQDGTLRPMQVKVGDRVHYGPHAGHDISVNGRECKILKEDEVLAVWRARLGCGCSPWDGCRGHEPQPQVLETVPAPASEPTPDGPPPLFRCGRTGCLGDHASPDSYCSSDSDRDLFSL